ncbi:hypothetical protein AMS68_005913 [Peltaster fructicola]|uniref:Rho termination factor N-terminal domain-containing protein n=1 Tax=Peltaster fructicola TaxID=286661 RepID=A0A6H0Y0D2_9PEZI|nr:hypothetical protein AMS68_005913 [Peltaster fructicola]
MTSWLNNHKKGELLELASTAGYQADESLKKAELVSSIDDYLQKNATRLHGQDAFEHYYSSKRPQRPRQSIGNVTSDVEEGAKSVVRKTVKKATKVKADLENTGASFLASPGKVLSDVASRISSPFVAAARTPAARRATNQLTNLNASLPTSPAEVTEEIERATTKFYSGAGDLYSVSGIPETVESVRSWCSSVVGVQTSILLLEAYNLRQAIFPWTLAFELPGVPALGLDSIPVYMPDLFLLLRSSFWGPSILWFMTSIFVPLVFAYFYNLTVHPVKRNGARVQALRYPYDPMTYNVVKAIATLLVYGAHTPSSYVDPTSARVVENAMVGGYRGVITGCVISGIAAIWEATQR